MAMDKLRTRQTALLAVSETMGSREGNFALILSAFCYDGGEEVFAWYMVGCYHAEPIG